MEMMKKSYCDSIGAIGLAKAACFHLKEHIRSNHSNDYHISPLENVVIVEDGWTRVHNAPVLTSKALITFLAS